MASIRRDTDGEAGTAVRRLWLPSRQGTVRAATRLLHRSQDQWSDTGCILQEEPTEFPDQFSAEWRVGGGKGDPEGLGLST